MFNNDISRLKFEDLIWVTFVFLSIANIIGDNYEIKYINNNDQSLKMKSNKVFEFTLAVTFLIYIYFFIRNYNAYKKATPKEKELYIIKLFGSSLLIAGVICLLYFQIKQTSFIGSPAL